MAIIKKLLPVFLGVAAGYAYWYFIGCNSGSCPITSNWYTSVIYGGIVGATWLLPTRRKTDPDMKTPNTTES
ncbi:MAG: DUF6132 family protein [Bacteroidota bacterium]|jgi:hypothetical protein|nr:DUF6132 family protein [Bacteroidota bacterium]